jgi:hypothetical protein
MFMLHANINQIQLQITIMYEGYGLREKSVAERNKLQQIT